MFNSSWDVSSFFGLFSSCILSSFISPTSCCPFLSILFFLRLFLPCSSCLRCLGLSSLFTLTTAPHFPLELFSLLYGCGTFSWVLGSSCEASPKPWELEIRRWKRKIPPQVLYSHTCSILNPMISDMPRSWFYYIFLRILSVPFIFLLVFLQFT